MLGLERILGPDSSKALALIQQLRSQQPKPIEEMTELQARAWLLTQTMLTTMEIEDPIRGFVLRMADTFSDDQWLTMMRGLVKASEEVKAVLMECGEYETDIVG